MPKQNKSKWIYWLKEPKHPHWLDFRATGLSATEWNEKFKVSPSALIFMRNALVKKNNTKINNYLSPMMLNSYQKGTRS